MSRPARREREAVGADLRRYLATGRPRRGLGAQALGLLATPFVGGSPLTAAKLMDAARRSTGLSDFGQPDPQQALEVLLDSMQRQAALTPLGTLIQERRLQDALCTRLRAEQVMAQRPEIAAEPVLPVLVIAGLQRTGTTLLQRLLAADPRARALMSWEALDPVPPRGHGHGRDPRIDKARWAQRALRTLSPEFFAIHPVEAEAPEEDVLLLDLTFMSQAPEAMLRVPDYAHWLETQDMRPAYGYLRRMLQLLQWQRTGSHWVLKTPNHLEHLEVLLEVFPEAHVVQTHRDPCVTVASFCSMVAHGRGIFSDAVDPREVGQHWYAKIQRMLERSAQVRAAQPERFTDVAYGELMADPVRQVARIYEAAALPLGEAARNGVRAALSHNRQHRFGRHHYRLSDYGLAPFSIRQDLQGYCERHAIAPEAGMHEPAGAGAGSSAGGHANPGRAMLTALKDLSASQKGLALGSLRCEGRRVLVTGANRGLGLAVAQDLRARGAELWLLCRSGVPQVGQQLEQLPGAAVHMQQVDLADLRSVHATCDALRDGGVRLDTVVLNAGLMPRTARVSAQGHEIMFAVHYLANFVLVQRLLADGVLRASTEAPPRIVFVSSEAHKSAAPLDPKRLGEPYQYGMRDGIKYYGLSKLLNLMLARELSRRLAPGGRVHVSVLALCPGAVATDIAREAPAWAQPLVGPVMRGLFQSPQTAAIPVVQLACAPELEGATGLYWHMRQPATPAPECDDRSLAADVWRRTETLVAAFAD